LPDPQKRLRGEGKQVRNVRLEDATTLDRPAIQALITASLLHAPKPLDGTARRQLIIKSVSAKQRPRRPAA